MSTTVLTAIFLRLLAIFPSGEKLIAPEMQCIVHAVVFKTKRNKVELQTKVDK
jgi:hypothetical protein